MKKLYENIEDIHIIGSPEVLTEMVKAMDISMQNMAAGTEQITALLIRYRESNKGQQYGKVIFTLLALENTLYQASQELNEMQREIVAYQNKLFRYEDMSATASAPNAFMVERKQIDIDTQSVQFTLSEMLEVDAELKNYSEAIKYHTNNLNQSKIQIGTVWMDTQYKDFSEFIDEVIRNIIEALKVFDEYVIYLEEKIKELK